ncbi:MAG: hypothetical protein VKJ24_16005 [Synechococcales bacterium]|nr:hypothetical protein [Synechococcales bacterium]
MFTQHIDPVRQEALTALASAFTAQGHPAPYAQQMAIATVFQADLELRNAQLACILTWLQQEHPEISAQANTLVEKTREEFENRIAIG